MISTSDHKAQSTKTKIGKVTFKDSASFYVRNKDPFMYNTFVYICYISTLGSVIE